MLKAGEVGLSSQLSGDFRRVKATRKDLSGHAFKETFQAALETADDVQGLRGYGSLGGHADYHNQYRFCTIPGSIGRVAELADAQDSGSCDRKIVGVQVPPRPR